MNKLIRKATREDIPRLVELERECFEQPWSPETFSQCMEEKFTTFFLVEHGGKIAGYLGYQMIFDEMCILNVGVERKSRGTGLGSLLLEAAIAVAQRANAQVTLEVLYNNEPAKRLYFSHGFVEEGRRKDYYGKGKDALILWRRWEYDYNGN